MNWESSQSSIPRKIVTPVKTGAGVLCFHDAQPGLPLGKWGRSTGMVPLCANNAVSKVRPKALRRPCLQCYKWAASCRLSDLWLTE